MQDRYTGDIGDFGKYGLLRELADPRQVLTAPQDAMIGDSDEGETPQQELPPLYPTPEGADWDGVAIQIIPDTMLRVRVREGRWRMMSIDQAGLADQRDPERATVLWNTLAWILHAFGAGSGQ